MARRFWQLFGTIMLASLMAEPGHAACSAYRGQVSLNELKLSPGNSGQDARAPFIELKILDATVTGQASVFAQWGVSVVARVKSGSGKSATIETKAEETYLIPGATVCADGTWRTIPLPDGSWLLDKNFVDANVVLWEKSSGKRRIVDILKLGESPSDLYSTTDYESCDGLTGGQYEANLGPGASSKHWARKPDGTGPWVEDSSNSTQSYCGSNDGNATNSGKCAAADAGKLLLSIPNHAACSNQKLTVQACDSRFYNQGRDISLHAGFLQPASGDKAVHLTYTGQGSSKTVAALSANSAAPSTLTGLDFNADGIATLTLSYPDVGRLSLNAAYTGSNATGDSGVSMSGSATFVAAPASFALTDLPSKWVAGTSYPISVEARTASGNACTSPRVAPNFGQEGEGVNLTGWTRTAPPGVVSATGPSDGVWSAVTVGVFAQGKASVSNVSWSEVGSATVTVQVADGDYLGAGGSLLGKTDVALGPFRPAYLETALTAGCTAFTYAGQPIKATVTAKNAAGVTTLNYGYLGGAGMAKAVTLSNAGSSTGVGNGAMPATTFSAGVGAYDSLTWAPTGLPTSLPVFTLRAVDADSVTSEGHAEGSTQIRPGRARLLNAYGSEILDLKVPFSVEYWNGSYWTRNTADACTGDESLNPANAVRIKLDNGTLSAANTCVLDSGKPGPSNAGCTALASLSPVDKRYREGGVAGFSGDFNLWLQRPGPGKTGTVRVTAEVPDWLKYNWTGSLTNPSANVTFGVYRSGPVIHLREMY